MSVCHVNTKPICTLPTWRQRGSFHRQNTVPILLNIFVVDCQICPPYPAKSHASGKWQRLGNPHVIHFTAMQNRGIKTVWRRTLASTVPIFLCSVVCQWEGYVTPQPNTVVLSGNSYKLGVGFMLGQVFVYVPYVCVWWTERGAVDVCDK